MATLTLTSAMVGMAVTVTVEADDDLISLTDTAPLVRFIACNWAHNGGFGVDNSPAAWVPVYGQEAQAYFWLYVDDMANPQYARLYPNDDSVEPPAEWGLVFFSAAAFISNVIESAIRCEAELFAEMDEETRLHWLSEFLVEAEPWGKLFANLKPSGDEEPVYVEVALIDGSVLFITPNGTSLVRPSNSVDRLVPRGLTRDTQLESVPDDAYYRA
ncbi:MAG: hypothetical protein INF43_02200 [Alphaproteobacteria bacterium]|nr:hypothetical protein [Alphaproteobacteria bacterium]